MKPSTAILLAAGTGSRLHPLTKVLPKCLMPVGERPLLDYWLATLQGAGVQRVIVNVHMHSDLMRSYVLRPKYVDWVSASFEQILLGTAGTVRNLASALSKEPVIVAHADNLISCDFAAFLDAHSKRTKGTEISMMTFWSPTPTTCGIVDVDDRGVVIHMDEKPAVPTGWRANGAVYIFEPEVINFIVEHKSAHDISTDVLPHFMGKIQSWHNTDVLRDIGTKEQLIHAQRDSVAAINRLDDEWQRWYESSSEFMEVRRYLLQ